MAPDAVANSTPLGAGVIALAILGTLFVGISRRDSARLADRDRATAAIHRHARHARRAASLARVICSQVTESVLHGRNSQIVITDEHFLELAKLPNPVIIFLVLAVVLWLMMSRMVVGRHIYAMGGNEQAARLSGIRTERVKWLAYCIGSITASVAGILYISYQAAAVPANLGQGYELNAIAAAVVGGCSLAGGAGTIWGTVLGVLFLEVIIDGVGTVIKQESDYLPGSRRRLGANLHVGFQPISRIIRVG